MQNIKIILFIFIIGITTYKVFKYKKDVAAVRQIDFNLNILPIITQKCTPCHNPNGIAPFSLQNQKDFFENDKMIKEVIKKNIMPLWMPDHNFSSFENERYLTDTEKKIIINYINYNKETELSDKTLPLLIKKTKPPHFDTSITLSMQSNYIIKGNNKDRFINFYLNANIDKDYWVQGIELVPSNKKLVHHAWLFLSNNKISLKNKQNLINGVDAGFSDWLNFTPIYGYLPGFTKQFFPNDLSKKIQKQSDLILQIHYYSSPFPQEDSTYVVLYLNKKPSKNELKYLIINEDYLNKKLEIPKNKVITFKGKYHIEEDINLYSVIPHMHFRGKAIKAIAILPNNKEIPIIKIDNWNFNNQETYIFKNRIFLPKGTIIKYSAKFDNTKNNPHNPVIPAIDVFMGESSKDEMLQLIFEYYN